MLSGWGRLPRPGHETLATDLEDATRGAVLCRGLGRSQGDASLPARPSDKVVGTRLADRVLSFDPATGVLRAQAGFSLAALSRTFIPRGWFSPVTPGTKYVTLGGMVSCDVHGKNHHRVGCFGAHVRSLRLRLANDELIDCSPTEHAELFYATIGGMGLLGHILEVEVALVRIPSAWVAMQSERVPNIDAFVRTLGRAGSAWPMTMGWIDCLRRDRGMGRGILIAARWATQEEAAPQIPYAPREYTLPFELPTWIINSLTARALNTAYYWHHPRKKTNHVVACDRFLHPLDTVLHWNRAYGRRGFTQYQCVLPRRAGVEAVHAFMKLVTGLHALTPLCGIKDYGPQGKGLLSFPMEGTSIAFDLPISAEVPGIVDRLNEFVIEVGGRIYLGKDSFTRAEHFRRMEPRLSQFLDARERWDPHHRLRSAQSVRLFGDHS